MTNTTITAIDGLRVGHAHIDNVCSGCTVLLTPPEGAVAGVDVRGGAPGTYGTDTLSPVNLVDRVHGMFLSGGSGFGLSVGDGVRRFLLKEGVGFETSYGRVPIVSGAIIFDLGMNRSGRLPDSDLGYSACLMASSDPVQMGSVGAGRGATVGKLFGLPRAMKGGLGSYCIAAPTGLKVAALMVVNAFGDIFDPEGGRIIAGCRESPRVLNLVDARREILKLTRLSGFSDSYHNTVIGVVATNAKLSKPQLTKIAQMAHDGIARTVVPSHTLYDGDTIFAISCGHLEGYDTSLIGHLASEAVARSIILGVKEATSLNEIPCWKDLAAENVKQ
ncbi:MAG: P1 family peptidase [Deltaproteobacteria bacterium]|nr:P1 family peptidase [Deltaproteobacteria bacterium]MBW2069057.1 P1 family peptidase [Deltaproteobacteria bacterium]